MNYLLFSGGVDSTLIFNNLTQKNIDFKCVFVNYGQESLEVELQTVEKNCNKYSIDLLKIEFSLHLTNEFYVMGRNLFMVSLVTTFCDVGDVIYIGVNKSDEVEFPDCRKDFVTNLQQILLNGYNISLEAPLIDLTKTQILKELSEKQIIDYTYCYTPVQGKPCMNCLSCKIHLEALCNTTTVLP